MTEVGSIKFEEFTYRGSDDDEGEWIDCKECGNGCTEYERRIQCELCDKWTHTKCLDMSDVVHTLLGLVEGTKWFCNTCVPAVEKIVGSAPKVKHEPKDEDDEDKMDAENNSADPLNASPNSNDIADDAAAVDTEDEEMDEKNGENSNERAEETADVDDADDRKSDGIEKNDENTTESPILNDDEAASEKKDDNDLASKEKSKDSNERISCPDCGQVKQTEEEQCCGPENCGLCMSAQSKKSLRRRTRFVFRQGEGVIVNEASLSVISKTTISNVSPCCVATSSTPTRSRPTTYARAAPKKKKKKREAMDMDVEEIYDDDDDNAPSGSYICELCSLPLSSKRALERHLKIHTGTKDYTCSECGKSFYRSDKLKKHQAHHEKFFEFKGFNVATEHVNKWFKKQYEKDQDSPEEGSSSKKDSSSSELKHHKKSKKRAEESETEDKEENGSDEEDEEEDSEEKEVAKKRRKKEEEEEEEDNDDEEEDKNGDAESSGDELKSMADMMKEARKSSEKETTEENSNESSEVAGQTRPFVTLV